MINIKESYKVLLGKLIKIILLVLLLLGFIHGMKYAHDETETGRYLIDAAGGYLLK